MKKPKFCEWTLKFGPIRRPIMTPAPRGFRLLLQANAECRLGAPFEADLGLNGAPIYNQSSGKWRCTALSSTCRTEGEDYSMIHSARNQQ